MTVPPPASNAGTWVPYFLVRNYEGKCLDYGPAWGGTGATVFLNDCAQAHPVRVEEINDRHEVIVHAGNQVIGIHRPLSSTTGGPPPPQTAGEFTLELQTYRPSNLTTANQIFRLDGDSIILEGNPPCTNTEKVLCPPPPPQLVVQIQNARGANGSPLVVGPRNLADTEFWDFDAVNGLGHFPTRGFVTVATSYDLWNAVCTPQVIRSLGDPPTRADNGQPLDPTVPCTPKAKWGTVIVVTNSDESECTNHPEVGPCLDLSPFPPLTLTAGVTLRGRRRGTDWGPQLFFSYNGQPRASCEDCMIEVTGDYSRVTGLRMRGQSRDILPNRPYTAAVQVGFPGPLSGPPLFSITTLTQFIATVDHNDISDWGSAAVQLRTPYSFKDDPANCTFVGNLDASGNQLFYPCSTTVPDPSTGAQVPIANDERTLANVRVARNFLHHNTRNDGGYGVAVGRALIEGNIFLENRHAITADGEPHNEYRAWYNMVLSHAPNYEGTLGHDHYNQDFDMHGTGDPGHWYGGTGGYYVDIFRNTFLSANLYNRHNYELRGTPSFSTDFHENICLESHDDAVDFKNDYHQILYHDDYINTPTTPYQFGHPNPTTRFGPDSLGVGDFDNDATDDLFLATGAAWYFSPGGAREWRFLSPKTDTIDRLLLGDFDGDGRADVVAIHNGHFVVSWGGISGWEVLNADPTGGRLLLLPSAVSAMAVGDFDGDGHSDDIFFADGVSWWISYGGNTPFVKVNDSSFRRADLRFGDFDGDKATDVFGVVSNTWSYSKRATGKWADGYLRPALTKTVNYLFVADFNGDGLSDVATTNGWGFLRISYGGQQVWPDGTISAKDPDVAGIGHFLGGKTADLLSWNGVNFWISEGGISPPQRHSSQDMR